MNLNHIEDIYPLSPLQQGMLYHILAEPESSAFFDQATWEFHGALEVEAFWQAWQKVVDRHTILRTELDWKDVDEPVQIVYKQVELPVAQQDWRDLSPAEQRQRLEAFLRSDRKKGIDLTEAPLMRLSLIRMADAVYRFVWSRHHILLDGWSSSTLLKEVFDAYAALCNGENFVAGQPRPYRNYIGWLQQQDKSEAKKFWQNMLAGVENPTALGVRQPQEKAAADGKNYDEQQVFLPADFSEKVQSFARRHQLTLNSVIQGAWALLLSRYSGEKNVIFGATVSGRSADLPGLQSMVGLFINTLPVAVEIDESQQVLPWLKSLQARQFEMQQFEHSSLTDVQRWLPDIAERGQAMFESIFVFENYPVDDSFSHLHGGVEIRDIDVKQGETGYPLTAISMPGNELLLKLSYDTRRFDGATIAQILGHWRALIEALIAHADGCVRDLDMLSEAEFHQLVNEWNATGRDFPTGLCMHQLFEAQAAQTPEAIAVHFGNEQISYRELNRRANQLAHYLRKMGVGAESLVGICLERSTEMIVAQMAVLKAGGAYVPLDPAYPQERLQFILEDTQAPVLLASSRVSVISEQKNREVGEQGSRGAGEQGSRGAGEQGSRGADGQGLASSDQHPASSNQQPTANNQQPKAKSQKPTAKSHQPTANSQLVLLDRDWPQIAKERAQNPDAPVSDSNLAYVIYTSGSTGRPKGVAIEHRSAATLINWAKEVYSAEELACVLFGTSICFDLSIYELFVTLSCGGKVVLAENALQLPDLPAAPYVTMINTVPSAIAELVRQQAVPPSVRTVNLAGEPLQTRLVNKIYATSTVQRVYDLYGPSEDTTYSTFTLRQAHARETIGRPLANTQVYLVDDRWQPVPAGVSGELFIAGDGLARGYLNRPDLTAEKFLPCEWKLETGNLKLETGNLKHETGNLKHETGDRRLNDEHRMSNAEFPTQDTENRVPNTGTRMYRTGDLARYFPDGNIEFLGRIDHQVKIRGFRIELGEIESTLAQHADIKDVLVMAREDTPGERRLAAYVVLKNQQGAQNGAATLPVSDLRAFLLQKLPEYMTPSAFVFLAELPLLPNGKVNRKALPAPDHAQSADSAGYVAPRTPAEQKLADIWANVLGQQQVGIYDNFFELGGDSILSIQIVSRANEEGFSLSPRHLFEYQTVAELAQVGGQKAIAAEQGAVTGEVPLTPVQQWFFAQEIPERHHFNLPMLLELKRRIAPEILQKALQCVADHHDALRLRFVQEDARIRQFHAEPGEPVALACFDVTALSEEQQQAEMRQKMQDVQAGLDLEAGPLMRAALFDLGEQQSQKLLWAIHHLVVDGVSWRILLDDLQTALDALLQNQTPQLPKKTSSYKAWSERLQEFAHSDTVRADFEHWLARPHAALPRDLHAGENSIASEQTLQVFLSSEETATLLKHVPAAFDCRINEVLLAALALAHSRWTQAADMTVTLEGHGREDALVGEVDVSRTVGWFTTFYPVQLSMPLQGDLHEAVAAVKNQLAEVPNHGLTFGAAQMIEDAEVRAKFANIPEPEVLFNYMGQLDAGLDAGDWLRISRADSGSPRSESGKRLHVLEINCLVANGSLEINWTFSANLHRQATIDALSRHFVETLRAMIARSQAETQPAAAETGTDDFGLNRSDFDEILAELE